ncbi:heme o synthase [Oceanobacillus sp. FSL H7-0719]|uniref:heme o synthase n=1 Tax=Oceanobacillus sp. FSL H7-0719 TaxID=2954507 RepID=UPI00324702BE
MKEKLIQENKESLISNLKLLFKFKVLVANVLPVIAGLWLVMRLNDIPLSGNTAIVLLTVIGSLLVIAGALVINNWYDADIDTVMDRTKTRPTVTGELSLSLVLSIGVITTLIGFGLLGFTNWEVLIYSFIGWFTYVFPYTMWTKRKYTWNTIIGSVSGAVTPMIGWAAFDSTLHIVPIAFFFILFFWQMPHTYVIAIRKYDEYKAANVAMLPVVKGMLVTKRMMLIYIICLMPLPFMLLSLGWLYVIVMTLINIAWLIIVIRGFYIEDTFRWAQQNFLISVNYLMIVFLLAMIVTI